MWPIEENANRGRISDCAKPPSPPIRAFSLASVVSNSTCSVFSDIITNGAIFCQVDKINAPAHDKLDITEGYQLWNGAAPSLINIAAVINMKNGVCTIGPIKKIKEANA